MTRPRALLLSRSGLEPKARTLLRALAWSYPAPLSIDAAIMAVWPEGVEEPLYAGKVINLYVLRLRKKGWTIVSRGRRMGYALTSEAFDRLTLPINPSKERAR